MDKRLYWLWLQKGLGFCAHTNALLSTFGSAKAIFEAGESDWRLSGAFSEGFFGLKSSGLERLLKTDIRVGEKTLEYCDKNFIKVITPEDEEYPKRLLEISNYPAALFVRGDISCLNENKLSVGVIGTRRPSEYGIRAAEKIAGGLAESGVTIVSGGALGIDSIAHKSAIEKNGKTVLVMGCGHDTPYLSQNAALREEVTRHGATVTEYPPTSSVFNGSFPLRNRIISGVSNGVVIVEANLKSGTLNTAAHAKRQHKEIFAVPGDVSSVSYSGSNKLIIEGAKAVFSAKDVLEYYGFELSARKELGKIEEVVPFEGINVFPLGENEESREALSHVKEPKKEKEIAPQEENNSKISEIDLESVSKNAVMVYNVMKSGFSSLDMIVLKSELPVRAVLVALTELEIAGAVSSAGGNNYNLSSH